MAGAPRTIPRADRDPRRAAGLLLRADLLLRHHDYTVEVAGGFVAAQLTYDYIEADGIRLPSRRRAYLRGTDSRPSLDPLLVSIDISDVRYS